MADPLSLLATAGTVANILAVLGNTINAIGDLRSQWKEADLTVLSLESQLSALKTALNKIREWAESTFDDPHHQLVMDVDRCVACCRLLISKIDADMSQFLKIVGFRLDASAKFKLLLKTADFRNTQRMIEQQTAALTLLLTACNTTVFARQKGLLEKPQTRRVFKEMENDTASLFVHRDVDSILSSATSTMASVSSSKRSVKFDFDKELLISKIYEKWIRGSVKKSLRAQQPPPPPPDMGAFFDLGDDDKEQPSPVSSSTSTYSALSDCEKGSTSSRSCASMYPNRSTRWQQLRSITTVRKDEGVRKSLAIDNALKEDAKKSNRDYHGLLLGSESKLEILQAIEKQNPLNSYQSPVEIKPTSPISPTGIYETRLQLGQLGIHLFDVSGLGGKEKKWMHHFEAATFIIFVVNLADYDDGTKMSDIILLFDSMINSGWFGQASVILFFHKVGVFRQKLARNPLKNIFPDYGGGSDVHKATDYILRIFNKLNRNRLLVYPCVTEGSDEAVILPIFAAIKEAMLNDALKYVLPRVRA